MGAFLLVWAGRRRASRAGVSLSGCDFTQSNPRLLRDANQNVGVIAQKRPVNVGRAPT